MDKLEKAKEIIKANIDRGKYGIFDSRNIVGDSMKTIFSQDGLTVDICEYWQYFEVFGLADKEFRELSRYYDELLKRKGRNRNDKQ